MTEQRPGRKALFVGAAAPAARNTPEEIAQRVRELNEDLALALKGAQAKKTVKPLDPSHFGSEYATLVDAVNSAATQMAAAPVSVPAPGGALPEMFAEYGKKIDVLERRLEFMEKNNPVPMLIATPALDITEANAAYVAMTGIPEDKIVKTNLHDFAITNRSGEGPGMPSRRNGGPWASSRSPSRPACTPWNNIASRFWTAPARSPPL